jgi:CDP-diglyceride synthetase
MTVTAPPLTGRRRRIRITGLQAGIVLALVGVGLGAFFEVRPPDAYGVCMACHGRDLANSVVNSLFGSRLTVAPASLVFPLLTVVGVVIGAFVAAVVSSEFRWRKPSQPMRSFIYGVVVMNAALLAAACSIRLLLRTSAGDVLGLIGFMAMAAGVVLATVWLRRQALR